MNFPLAFLLATVGSARDAQEDEEACKKAMETFRSAFQGREESARVAAVEEAGRHRCDKMIGLLSPLLTRETDPVRIAAARALGAFDSPKAVEVLANAVGPNVKSPKVLDALAQALDALDWEVGATVLNPLLAKHHDKDIVDALLVVVPVLGKLGSPGSVEPLIDLLRDAENEGKRGRALGVRSGGNAKMEALKGPIGKALQEITGGKESSAKDWDSWWRKNGATLVASATVVYRCKATGKRWEQRTGKAQECPHHDKPEKDGQAVKVKLK